MKKIIVALLVIIALPFIAALFTTKEYHAWGSVNINRPIKDVFDYIVLLKNQENYSTWAEMDPEMKRIYQGTDGTVGFIAGWESQKEDVGVGEQEITAIDPYKRIDYELRFKTPFESTAPAYMTVESILPNETNVQWHFDGKMDYPMNIMLWFMDFETMISNDFDKGLDKLQVILEKK
ncbi:MAG: SRPBCC family protein [Flavobacteriales bacterium]|nr:SRPBCC family protein [Flavobacteriales bacterium]